MEFMTNLCVSHAVKIQINRKKKKTMGGIQSNSVGKILPVSLVFDLWFKGKNDRPKMEVPGLPLISWTIFSRCLDLSQPHV